MTTPRLTAERCEELAAESERIADLTMWPSVRIDRRERAEAFRGYARALRATGWCKNYEFATPEGAWVARQILSILDGNDPADTTPKEP